MSEKTKVLLIKIFSTLFVVAALVFSVIGLIGAVKFQKAHMIINIFALLLGISYVVFDFKKFASTFFKLFLFALAIKEGCALINMAVYEQIQWLPFLAVLVCYTCPLVLGVAKDLGKKKSLIIVSIYAVIALVSFIAVFNVVPTSTPDGQALAVYNGCRLLLIALLYVMMFAKYYDKSLRGSN